MYLTHLSLTNFRAFSRLDTDVPRRILLLVGNNAQGKTSILESIFYLATFTSLTAHSDRQLINFLANEEQLSVARLVADFQTESKKRQLEIRLIVDSSNGTPRFRKEILLDGVKSSVGQAIGAFNAVIFLPQMTRMIEGGPEERRRYLNLALSQAIPGYGITLSEYHQALNQRNALLKQLSERSGDTQQLAYWDDLITDRGAKLIHSRMDAIQQLEHWAAITLRQLTGSREVLRLLYLPAYDPFKPSNGQFILPMDTRIEAAKISVDEIREGFLNRLAEIRREEIVRGVTTIGPHRDDFRILSNGIDLGDYGSRGQTRSAILALKMAEVSWLKERTGNWPVLLLDEILAELDLNRRHDLLTVLDQCDQCLLTTTDMNLFEPQFLEDSSVWMVDSGSVQTFR
jgi:DNA replication and repair protein RecF